MPRKPNQYGIRRRGKKWTARPYIPGKGHVWGGTHDSEEEAIAAAVKKLEEERRLPANKETVATFAARWVKDFPRPKESTNDRYHKDAERFAEYVGPNKKLHDVTVPEARAYALKHRHDLGALRAMFSDARRDGLVSSNPFSELGISKGPGRSGIVVVTAEELGELVEVARRTHGRFGSTFRAVLIFAAHTGLRPGEIFGLDWCDIDYEAETIHVRQQFHKRRLTLPKNGKARTVFLPPPAAQALKAMPRTVSAAHVFCGMGGQRITQSALSGYWKPVKAAFLASLSESRAMDFERAKGSLDFYSVTRHYCASSLIEQGVESWIVAKQLGHEDGGRLVEKVYGHPRDEIARERLQRVYKGNVEPLRAAHDAEAAHG